MSIVEELHLLAGKSMKCITDLFDINYSTLYQIYVLWKTLKRKVCCVRIPIIATPVRIGIATRSFHNISYSYMLLERISWM